MSSITYNNLVDTHAHLQYGELYDDRKNIIERARNVGVKKIIVVGTNFEDSKIGLELCDEFENLYYSVGVHPNECSKIDEDYIKNARSEIKNNCSTINTDKWKKTFLEQTKVIWYEPQDLGKDNVNAIEIFSRLNVGKIPLTNSELIRALFLIQSKDSAASELNDFKLASEWDDIERHLHDEAFWNFITLGKPFRKDYPNLIEFLFDIIEVKSANDSNSHQTYSTFAMYDGWLNAKGENKKRVNDLWQEVKNVYYRLQEWFLDNALYHSIGFIRLNNLKSLNDLFKMADESKQSDLILKLKEIIAEKMPSEDDDIKNLFYGDDGLKKVLLLHNVASYERKNERFPFAKYTSQSWDIEHVHARADNVSEDQREGFMEMWIKYLENYPQKGATGDDVECLEKLKEKYKTENDKKGLFEKFRDVCEKLDPTENNISNLVLLDRGTNRSYKNDPFPMKRKEILRREKEGKLFISLCTRNVFTKCYSLHDDISLGIWDKIDQEAYCDDIVETIKNYLPSKDQLPSSK